MQFLYSRSTAGGCIRLVFHSRSRSGAYIAAMNTTVNSKQSMVSEDPPPLRVLEFYSGIGGMRSAIQELCERSSLDQDTAIHRAPQANDSASNAVSNSAPSTPQYPPNVVPFSSRCVQKPPIFVGSFDVSTAANEVYSANYPGHPPSQKPIESLSPSKLDELRADLWLMSPPCQPYTRQRQGQSMLQRDIQDKRATSFTHLTRSLSKMKCPPACILLENVVGFEASESCTQWLDALKKSGFDYAQFHLSPTQFGVPNVRPRYFCIARHQRQWGAKVEQWMPKQETHSRSMAVAKWWAESAKKVLIQASLDSWTRVVEQCPRCIPAHGWGEQTYYSKPPQPLCEYLHANGKLSTEMSDFLVSRKTLERPSSWCADLVCPSSRRSGCFTKSYGSFLKGTGSLVVMEGDHDSVRPEELMGGSSNTLDEMVQEACVPNTSAGGSTGASGRPSKRAKVNNRGMQSCSQANIESMIVARSVEDSRPANEQEEPPWFEKFGSDRIRYFTPTEIASLLGFPSSFIFPSRISRKKRYALLGNSLHVGTVARLLHILLSDE